EIPRLYHYAQLLLALAVNEARYGATGTPLEFWHRWRERDLPEEELARLRGPRSADEIEELRGELQRSWLRAGHRRELEAYLESLALGREITEQDRLLYALCRPERLLEITRDFTLFEGGARKVARYQQYFCVKQTMDRIRRVGPDGVREGGVVW